MGDITGALRNATSGLLVNQQALAFISQNVANVNTEGYSRRIINQESRVVTGVPAGVQLSEITRSVDENLLRSVRTELSELNQFSSQTFYFDRIQEFFGTPQDNTSLGHIMGELQNAAELLAVTPDRTLEQNDFVQQAQRVLENLNDLSESLQTLRLQADQQINLQVTELNTLVQNVDQLNDDIISVGSAGNDTSDLEDARDGALDSMAAILDIRYFSRNDGDVVVFTSSGKTLVDTVPPTISHTAASSIGPSFSHDGGEISGIFVGPAIAGNDITNDLRGGNLGGLVDMRDNVLPNLQSQLDEIAAELQTAINQVHNRGVSFPGAQTYSGTRIFVDPTGSTPNASPQFSMATGDDTAFVLFDDTGNQQQVVRFTEILTGSVGGTTLGSGADLTGSAISVTEFAARFEDWLQANGAANASAAVGSDGKFDISMSQPGLNLAFRDEAGTSAGSALEDSVISFDANADGVTDETVNGFSNFFGLNDLIVDTAADNNFDSQVLASSFVTTAATLSFQVDAGFLPSGGAAASLTDNTALTVPAGTSLTDLATSITNNIPDITATVVTDGSGVRLRLSHDDGESFVVTQSATDTLLGTLGLEANRPGLSQLLSVRSDIETTPGLVASAQVQYDSTKGIAGEYFTSSSDGSNIEAIATTLSSNNSFDVAGGQSALTLNFTDYASTVIARSSVLADTNQTQADSQRILTDALQFQSDNIRGVNLDEELAQLIVFEQAFSASARVLTVIQDLIDELSNAVV